MNANMANKQQDYRIHGDNIVECERTLEFIARALGFPPSSTFMPSGSPLTPTYSLQPTGTKESFRFTFLPGYGRWDTDIREVIRRRGGRLREQADAIVCRFQAGSEEPLLAIEYSGALPAGNQAWQRNGRALSFAHAGLIYAYIAELSGFELNALRERKAARLPNPAVPFSYLLLTESTKSPAIPVFLRSPGASENAVLAHAPFYGEEQFLEILRCLLLGEPTDAPRRVLEEKVLALVQFLASSRRRGDTLAPDQWAAAFAAVSKGEPLPSYLAKEAPLTWAKTAYIGALTPTARELMTITARLARGLTSATLPMCLVLEKDRRKYAEAIRKLYPATPRPFLEWCAGAGHLAVCWVMGFKPRGDDARPDRGLPPLCRMLVGEDTDMLTVVYGPAPAATWPRLNADPADLMVRNGLWEAVLVCSDAVFVDAGTLPAAPPLAYLKSHWAAAIQPASPTPFAVTPVPNRAAEHDVDTVIHLLLARLGHPHVFEGLCNPPGGDWSGLSMLTEDRSLELRWLVLPRVTAAGAKRPDHVFQVFDAFNPFLVIAIESKERPQSVEPGIGPRLHKYVGELVAGMPSVHRAPASPWAHYVHATDRPAPQIATAAAFVAANPAELGAVAALAEVDLVLGFSFPPQLDSCTLWIRSCTPLGEQVATFLESLSMQKLKIAIKIQS